MKQKIVIEIETNFSNLRNEEEGRNATNEEMEELEKEFQKIVYEKLEELIIDEDMELQEEILNKFCEENFIDDVEDYSDLGEVRLSISKEKVK